MAEDRAVERVGRFFSTVLGLDDYSERTRLAEEKGRLEAVLNAAPEPFCGWSPAGFQAIAPDFQELMGHGPIRSFADLLAAVEERHHAALSQAWSALVETAAPFTLFVERRLDGTLVRLRGGRGTGFAQGEVFHVLWGSLALPEKVGRRPRFIDSDLRNQLIPALNMVDLPVWLRNPDGRLLWCNQAYGDALDLSIDQAIEDDRALGGDAARELSQRARRSDTRVSIRQAVVIGGERRHLELFETYLRLPEFSIGYAVDRSAIEQAELDSRRRAESHARVLEQLAAGILIFGADRRLSFHNAAFQAMTRVDDGVLDDHPSLSRVLDAMRQRRALPEMVDFPAFQRAQNELFTNLMEPQETILHLPDGRALRMIVTPHNDKGLVFTFEDVTSQMQLESAYNTLIRVQRETLANLSEGVAVFGTDGLLQLYNPAFAAIWSLSDSQLAGAPHITQVARLLSTHFDVARQSRDIETMFTELVLGGIRDQGEVRRLDDSILRYRTRPLPDGGVLISFIDITDSVRVEQALRDKTAALEAADQLKADFLANVSYKLRTPLNTISGYSEMLEQGMFGRLNDGQGERVRAIVSASQELSTLIDDILDMATLEAGYMTLKRERTDVAQLLAQVADLTREWAGKNELRMAFEVEPEIGTAVLDPRRIKQALVNLISNAIRFTQPGGRITVRARRASDRLRLVVSDTGVGIAASAQDKVFAVFYQAPDATSRKSGSGLGLPLVKRLVEMHGGTVSLSSEPGRGTTVSLELPVAAPG